jgi:hypothetical protein
VTEQMGMQFDTGDRRILVAHRSDASIRQRASLADKQLLQMKRWSDLKIRLNRPSSGQRQWDAALFSQSRWRRGRRSVGLQT